jgi:hypothetical protein
MILPLLAILAAGVLILIGAAVLKLRRAGR